MPEESYSFAKTRVRLEEIVSQVRKKDTSLEKSLDLLEEGVRLANQCTELIDHADWEAAAGSEGDRVEGEDLPVPATDGAFADAEPTEHDAQAEDEDAVADAD